MKIKKAAPAKNGPSHIQQVNDTPTRFKAKVRVKTYWLSGENLQRVQVIMGWRAVA